MGTTFRAHGWHKHAEEDIFEQGCLPNTSTCYAGHELFSDKSAENLVEELRRFTGAEKSDIELDACDEYGRVDIAVMETADCEVPSEAQIAEWKAGKRRLWYCVYTFHVEACSPVMFKRPRSEDVRQQTKDWTPEQLAIGRPFTK